MRGRALHGDFALLEQRQFAFARCRTFHQAAQDDDAPLPAPRLELQPALDPLKALPRVHPARRALHLFDERFHHRALPQFEKIPLPTRLTLAQKSFLPVRQIPPHKQRTLRRRQLFQNPPKPRVPVLRRSVVTRLHLHVQTHPQPPDKIAVIREARTPRLTRIIALLRPILVTVNGLNRRINIQHPRLTQKRPVARPQLAAQPTPRSLPIHRREEAPRTVFAHHFRHPQKRRVDRVKAHGTQMRIPPLPAQNAQNQRAQHIASHRRIRARKPHRARRAKRLKKPRKRKKLSKENELPNRSQRSLRIPLHKHRAARRLHPHRPQRRICNAHRLTKRRSQKLMMGFTLRVKRNKCRIVSHPLYLPPSSPLRTTFNCGF